MKNRMFVTSLLALISLFFVQFACADDNVIFVDSDYPGTSEPFNIALIYSDEFYGIVEMRVAKAIARHTALAIELAGGWKEFRVNMTLGQEITENQRIKISAEYLLQELFYSFDSGSEHHWSGQAAAGASYQYLLHNRFIKGFDISGFYANAESKTYAKKFSSEGILVNRRRVAGSDSAELTGGVTTTLWPGSYIGASFGYAFVDYRTNFSNDPGNDGFAEHVEFQQLLGRNVKLHFYQSYSDLYEYYEGGLFWLVPTDASTRLELGVIYSYLDTDATIGHENRVAINIGFAWDANRHGARNSYAMNSEDPSRGFVAWTAKPAARMETVLTVSDQITTLVGDDGGDAGLADGTDAGTDTGIGDGTDTGTGDGTDTGTGDGTDIGTGGGTGDGTDIGTGDGTDTGIGDGTDTGTGDGTDTGTGDGTDTGTGDGTDTGTGDGTDTGTGDGTDTGTGDGTDTGTGDGTDTGTGDGTDTGTGDGTDTGTGDGTDTGTGDGTDTGTGDGTDTGTGDGTDTGTGDGTDTGTDTGNGNGNGNGNNGGQNNSGNIPGSGDNAGSEKNDKQDTTTDTTTTTSETVVEEPVLMNTESIPGIEATDTLPTLEPTTSNGNNGKQGNNGENIPGSGELAGSEKNGTGPDTKQETTAESGDNVDSGEIPRITANDIPDKTGNTGSKKKLDNNGENYTRLG